MQPHTEISRQSPNLFSVEEVAETIGADVDTVNKWLKVGAIDRAVFGGGQFSKIELCRAALVLELGKFCISPSCAKEIIREMEYDLQQIWERIPRHFKAYAIIIPTNRKWLVSWCWTTSTAKIDPIRLEGHIALPVSDIVARITDQTKQVP